MKLYTGNDLFEVDGLVVTDEKPEKCEDWEDSDFGSEAIFECGQKSKVDLRHLMTRVESQGSVKSCTANAVAGAYEYLANIVAKKNGDSVGDISRLFIYYVTRKYDLHRRNRGHQRVQHTGSTISGAINVLMAKGACLEDTYPYYKSRINSTPHSEAFNEALDYKISKCWEIKTDVNAFKSVLNKGLPIIFGCKLYESFGRNRGRGIHRRPSSGAVRAGQHGAHAMLIVGYYDSHQCFVVRNSWGTGWGHDGYCFMSYDYIANPEFNLGQNFAIYGLTDYDFTPEDDDDDTSDLPDFDAEDLDDEDEEVELLDDCDCEDDSDLESDHEDEDDDEFDEEEFFSKLADAKIVFDKLDANESGMIDRDELARGLKMSGVIPTDEALDAFMEEYDCDESGELGFVEFLKILDIEVPEELLECDSDEEEEEDEEEEDDEEDDEEEEDEEEEEEEEEDEGSECCDDEDPECSTAEESDEEDEED